MKKNVTTKTFFWYTQKGRMRPSFPKLLLLFLLPILIYFHLHGVIVHDEGYIINSAQKVINGEVVYRDFHFSYTPLSIFLTSLSFVFFDNSILSSRILMILIDLMSVLLIVNICKIITRKNIYAFFASIVYVAWGPTHINFVWPIMFAIPLTLLAIYFVLLFEKTSNAKIPFITGLLAIAVFLAKQNFGIILIPLLFYFILKKKIMNTMNFLYGAIWGLIAYITYLLVTGSFGPFLNDFYTFTIKKILLQGDLTTPLLFIDTFFPTTIRLFFYFILPTASLALIVLLLYRRKYNLIFIPLITLFYSAVGLRPTSDYIHLVPLISLTGIIIVIFMNKLPILYVKILGYLVLVILLIAGFQTALFKGYYRWDTPLLYNNSFVGDKVSVFTDKKFSNEYNLLKNYVNLYTKKGDYIYIDTYAPIFYYALERKQPTEYDFPGFIDGKTYEKKVIYNLVGKEVKLVFLTNGKANTPVESYVIDKYRFVRQIGDYYLYILP